MLLYVAACITISSLTRHICRSLMKQLLEPAGKKSVAARAAIKPLWQPRQARTLRPLLQFFYASELPVYATSHAYSGNPSPVADQDLEGLLFADMPWVLLDNTPQQILRGTLAGQSPASFAQYKRLYALGVDAYHLLAQLDRLRGSPEEHFEGDTGSLTLDAANRIHRHLVWARFVNGAPQPLEGAR